MGNAINQTVQNATQNLDAMLNGNQSYQVLATSAGPIPMENLSQNYMAFQNAGAKSFSGFAGPSPPQMNAAQHLMAKSKATPRTSNVSMMAGPRVSGDT